VNVGEQQPFRRGFGHSEFIAQRGVRQGHSLDTSNPSSGNLPREELLLALRLSTLPLLMRPIWWILIFILISACALWMVAYPRWSFEDHPIVSRIATGYFLLIGVGPCWMAHRCWEYDRSSYGLRKMWWVFVPGGFLWYYFERFRPRQLRNR
jgi:hypothetical protein